MIRRRFVLCATVFVVLLAGCLGSKGNTTVNLTPDTANKLELVDWGKGDNALRVKLKNKSSQKVPEANDALFIKWYDKQGQPMGMPDRIMNFHLQAGATEKYEIQNDKIDKVGKVEIGIADARRGI